MTNGLTAGLLTAVLLAMTVVPASATSNASDPLAPYRGKARILVMVASTGSDPQLAKQRALFRDMQAGATERDLVLVEASGDTAQAAALRREFGLGQGFHAVLVGKDGGGKLTSADPLRAEQVFPLIDSMPMRQNEMQRR